MISLSASPWNIADLKSGKQVIIPSVKDHGLCDGAMLIVTLVSDLQSDPSLGKEIKMARGSISHLEQGDEIDDWYIEAGFKSFWTIYPEELLTMWLS